MLIVTTKSPNLSNTRFAEKTVKRAKIPMQLKHLCFVLKQLYNRFRLLYGHY